MCAYSRDAALCNYSFLVRFHAHPSLQCCTWQKYTSDFPIRYDRTDYPACMHAVSAICPWATVLVFNMVSVMDSEP